MNVNFYMLSISQLCRSCNCIVIINLTVLQTPNRSLAHTSASLFQCTAASV